MNEKEILTVAIEAAKKHDTLRARNPLAASQFYLANERAILMGREAMEKGDTSASASDEPGPSAA